MNDAFACHLVDERDRLLQRGSRAGEIVLGDRGADASERVPQLGSELTIALSMPETLTIRLQRGCVRSHVGDYLQNHQV